MNVFLDANILIYWLEGEPAVAQAVQRLVAEAMALPGAVLCMSALSLMECRVRPQRLAQTDVLARYDALFASRDLLVAALDAPAMRIATMLRAHHGLKTPDALQAASCLSLPGEHRFITADKGFLRAPGLQVVLFRY